MDYKKYLAEKMKILEEIEGYGYIQKELSFQNNNVWFYPKYKYPDLRL